MTEPFIVIDTLDKNYGDHHAVRGIDLSIGAGEFIAVMGPSGCGKSTLLRMIAGLEQPTGGDIRIVGKSVLDVPAHERGTPMVWQSLALFPFLTVAENIAFPLRMKQVPPGEQRRRVMEWVERLGLSGMEDRDIARLSGGQRQRVAIARALITQPSILLLDEPLSALDAHLRVRMQTELARLHKQLGITFIYVTHAQSEAFALADRVVIMSEGKIQQSGRPEDVYRAPANAFVADFIGMNNRIAGRVLGPAGAGRAIETPYGTFRVAAGLEAAGAALEYVIAADRVAIGATEPADAARDRLRGTVLGQEFVGSTQTIFVEVENGPEFRVQKQQHDLAGLDLSPGAPVWLHWSPAETWILPEAIKR